MYGRFPASERPLPPVQDRDPHPAEITPSARSAVYTGGTPPPHMPAPALSFAEYYSAVGGDKQDAFDEFAFYGGMPLILSRPTNTAKMAY